MVSLIPASDPGNESELSATIVQVLDRYPFGIYVIDEQSNLLYINQAMCKIAGCTPKELYNNPAVIYENVHREDRDKVSQENIKAMKARRIFDMEFRMLVNGETRWYWVHSEPVPKQDGSLVWYGTQIDITDRKEKEEALISSERKYRIATDCAPDWNYWIDQHGEYVFISPGCKTISGYTAQEFMSSPSLFEEIIHPDEKLKWTGHKNSCEHSLGSNNVAEHVTPEKTVVRIIHKNGTTRWLEHVCRPVFDETGNYLGRRGVNRDVSRREEAFRELSKLHKGMHESPVSVVITDSEGIIEYVNKKFTEVTGYSLDEVVGQNPRLLRSGYTSEEEYETLWCSIKSGRTWTGEFLNVRKDGTTYWENAVITPILDDSGNVTNFIALKEDITIRKEQEENLHKILEVVGDQNRRLLDYAYIISHNVRSHASNIAALLTEMELATNSAERNELFALLAEVSDKLMETLTYLNDNLNAQKEINLIREPIDLQKTITALAQNYQSIIAAIDGRMKTSVPRRLSMTGNPVYIRNILDILVQNAIQYRSTDRQFKLEISVNRVPGGVELIVHDNGVGIDLHRFGSKLFKMGQVFHQGKTGRGVGLFIVKSQVEAMGGSIRVNSEPGKGTTFTIFLPG